jgi:hypothetical protein
MVAFTVKNCQQKVLVVGPIYDKIDKLQKIKEIEHNYQYIIFNGNLCYPYENTEELEERIKLFDNKKWLFNAGQFDLLALLNSRNSEYVNKWIKSKPNVIIVEFTNKTNLIILGGGVLPKMIKSDLLDNLEVSFVSKFNNESWHKSYGGSYGYIISNNPLTNKKPEFYNYSMQLGNIFSPENNVYAQEADQYGLKETILL